MSTMPGRFDALGTPPDGVVIQGSGADASVVAGPIEIAGQRIVLRELGVVGGDPIARVTGEAEFESVSLREGPRGLQISGTLLARELSISNITGPAEDDRSFDGPNPSPGAAFG